MSRCILDSPVSENALTVHPDDAEVYAVDLDERLPSGVTVESAVATYTLDDGTEADDLTIEDVEPSIIETTYEDLFEVDHTVDAGRLLNFSLSGGTAGADYLITFVCTCSDFLADDLTPRTRTVVVRLEVRDGTEDQ